MKCPYCGKDNTRVIDSRPADDGDSIRRRRECDECHKRFTTYEKVETIPMIVIKKDNNRETYDRAKVEGGVFRACHKRPVSATQIEAMIDDVESSIFSKEEREISSRQIGNGYGKAERPGFCGLCQVCFRVQRVQRCEYIYG